ncbi:hypothetical protein BJX61DRAFT_543153 [Aspergillus egyptiacus]|nr:hypothetical protein BJX61DRAFT_543153 [Aspergillus egyptiacus]
MPTLAVLVAALWLLRLQLVAAAPTYNEPLREIPNDTTSVDLADHETFMWASTDVPHPKAVVVSMVAYSKQDERILDMDKFTFALQSASCTAEDFSVKFKHVLIYKAAKIAWGWVNYNNMRSFVLVPDWKGCGRG